jgi:hypothetical protein
MRIIKAKKKIGLGEMKIHGIITNDIYDGNKEIIGYEIKLQDEFVRIRIKDFDIDIKEVAIL